MAQDAAKCLTQVPKGLDDMKSTIPPVKGQSASISVSQAHPVVASDCQDSAVQKARSFLEGADDILFVVDQRGDSGILARCSDVGLNVTWSQSTRFEREIRGKRVIVVTPKEGELRQQALDTADRCRGIAASVKAWEVPALGSAAAPTLKAFASEFALEKVLLFEEPWLDRIERTEPHVNGDGRRLENDDGSINYPALSASDLNVRNASTFKKRPIPWVWYHRFPAGEMSLLAGEGGLGKSQMTLWMAAAVSKGWQWPDRSGNAPTGRVIIVTAEDDPEQTIVPRLEAMESALDSSTGADLTKIEIITSPKIIIKKGHKETYVDLRQRDYWERLLDIFPDTKLLIIDPVASHLGRGVSDQKNDEVRSVLEPLIERVIRPRKIAFIAITHLNKSLEAKSVKHRINASIAFVNIPRNVHCILVDPENLNSRVFGQIKCNNAPANLKSIKFTIEGRTLQSEEGMVETSVPVFDPELHSIDLNRTMTGEKGHRGPSPAESVKFAGWLYDQIKDQPVRLGDLIADAREQGLMLSPTSSNPKPSPSPLYNAKRRLPKVYAGYDVDEFELDNKKYWQLISVAAAGANGASKPF
jgi:putative DNA primase/helicase